MCLLQRTHFQKSNKFEFLIPVFGLFVMMSECDIPVKQTHTCMLSRIHAVSLLTLLMDQRIWMVIFSKCIQMCRFARYNKRFTKSSFLIMPCRAFELYLIWVFCTRILIFRLQSLLQSLLQSIQRLCWSDVKYYETRPSALFPSQNKICYTHLNISHY